MSGSKSIIVIGREFGCGARNIGKILSERLGVPYYDKELFRQIQMSSGLTAEVVAGVDERRPSMLRSFLGASFGSPTSYGADHSLSDEAIYKWNSEAIQKISEEGGAVIVGRTADYILRDHPDLLSVFLHAPIDYRVARLVERGECSSAAEAKSLAAKQDKLRKNYYRYYTGREWGKASTYHLCINSSVMTDEEMADIIIRCLDSKRKNIERNKEK